MPVTNYYTVGGELLGERTAGGSRTDYLTDALGSVVATVNPAAQVVNTYRYKPYGALLAKTGVGADPAFRWVGSQGYRQTGKRWSDVYVRARHYDTAAGMWIAVDPLWPYEPAYQYAAISPVSLIDRSGMLCPPRRHPCAANGFSPSRVCDYYRRHPLPPPDVGVVVCCEGEKFECFDASRIPSGYDNPPGLATCVIKHEKQHTPDVDCASCGTRKYCRPDYKPDVDPNESECRAWKATFLCLQDEMNKHCHALRGVPRKKCIQRYMGWLILACSCGEQTCGGNSPKHWPYLKECDQYRLDWPGPPLHVECESRYP